MTLFYKLSFFLLLVVLSSNYLVQIPFQHFGLSEILTYGAFSYPITFLITDLANRAYGKFIARKIVYIGFIIGILLTVFVSTNFSDLISIRIAIGSGTAFFIAQNLDIQIFDILGKSVLNLDNVRNPINVSELKSGVYFVQITLGAEKETKKLIIN